MVDIVNPGPGVLYVLANDGSTVLTELAADEKISMVSELPAGGLAAAVAAWVGGQAGSDKIVGGSVSFVSDDYLNWHRTYIDASPKNRIRQHCNVTSFRFKPHASPSGSWRAQIWRFDGTSYNLVGQSQAFTPSGTGIQTVILSAPIACLPGDYPAMYVPGGSIECSVDSDAHCVYANENPSTITSPTTYPNARLDITAYAQAPFLITMGHSMMCAHGNIDFYPFRDGGTLGDEAAQPASYLRAEVPDLTFQNFAKGSSTWADAASVIGQVAAIAPKAVVFMHGLNDVFFGRTLAQTLVDMDTCKAALPTGTKIFVLEVLPDSSVNDTMAAAIRSLNANYATWCASNGATLIECHDAMGQIRSSTGELDDLKTAYNDDGTHLTVPVGITALTTIIYNAVNESV